MKTNKLLAVFVASTLCLANFKEPATANPITAPACKDAPSCVFAGTVVVSGVVYYLIKNTVTGVVQRIPARQVHPDTHRNIGDDPYPVGTSIRIPGIVTRNKCLQKAKDMENQFGGEWVIDLSPPDSGSNTNVERTGEPEFTPLFICHIRRVR